MGTVYSTTDTAKGIKKGVKEIQLGDSMNIFRTKKRLGILFFKFHKGTDVASDR